MLETLQPNHIKELGSSRRARVIAHYLPQYYPIPENDQWWGKGFTEWTNTAKAKPLFRGHHQPNVPADLGFYDLRVPETRQAQADMARAYGVEAFCYWHYWFAGERLLERPFNEVLRSGEPDFPFCLGWANHTWSGIWYGAPKTILKEQTYPGMNDYEAHFYTLLEAFSDPRYLTVDGKPFLLIFSPLELPEPMKVTDFWRELAIKSGLKGLHIVGVTSGKEWNPKENGFDAVTITRLGEVNSYVGPSLSARMRRRLQGERGFGRLYSSMDALKGLCSQKPMHVRPYADVVTRLVVSEPLDYEYYPCVIPNWDNTPRSGKRGTILLDSTPELFRKHLHSAVAQVSNLAAEHQILILKSWNEWAEGNYMEPDLKYGRAYLEVLKDEITDYTPAKAVR